MICVCGHDIFEHAQKNKSQLALRWQGYQKSWTTTRCQHCTCTGIIIEAQPMTHITREYEEPQDRPLVKVIVPDSVTPNHFMSVCKISDGIVVKRMSDFGGTGITNMISFQHALELAEDIKKMALQGLHG